jgi:hypothetical protein
MDYFIIDDIDFSMCVNALKVGTTVNYSQQQNAAGDSVVDYVNKKRVIEVGIIPLDAEKMVELQNAIAQFEVYITFLNPLTNELEQNVRCIIPGDNVEYYTIQHNKVLFKAYTIQFQEL